jgi:uncharacterized membrane protein YheB (UPF0754 family)
VAVVVSVAATSLVAVLKVKAMAASSHARMTVVLTTALKDVRKTVSKAVKTIVLMHLVATASSHVKARLAATLVRTVALKAVVVHLVATLAKAMAHHVATSVPHVASKTARHAALMTVPQHVVHAPRLKQVAHRLTSQAVQPVASRLVAVLMQKNAHLSHAHLVNEVPRLAG